MLEIMSTSLALLCIFALSDASPTFRIPKVSHTLSGMSSPTASEAWAWSMDSMVFISSAIETSGWFRARCTAGNRMTCSMAVSC